LIKLLKIFGQDWFFGKRASSFNSPFHKFKLFNTTVTRNNQLTTLLQICILSFLIFSSGNVFAQQKVAKIDSISYHDGLLYSNIKINNIFSEKILEGLNRGLTVGIEYEVRLWRMRSNWFDSSFEPQFVNYKLRYNKLNKRYIWRSQSEQIASTSFEKVSNLFSELIHFEVVDTTRLKKENVYYIVVEAVLKPLSVENFEEMSKWVKGEIQSIDKEDFPSAKKTQETITSGMFRFVKNIAGFGDIIYYGKTRDFTFDDNWNVVWQRR